MALSLPCLLALSGCGGDEPPPAESYAPLHYEYLKQLRLNVASVDVVDHSAPAGSRDMTAQDPVSPGQVLAQMGRDRLYAAGTAGRAVFTVDTATIRQGEGGALNGELGVHVAVFNDAGQQMAYAEARVTRQHVPGSDPENLRNNLYDMTRQMMDDMNVELEYQVRRSMRGWLVTNTAVPAPVIATPLSPASPAPPAPAPAPQPEPMAPLADQPPPSDQAPVQSPPMRMSPPPGFLQPPVSQNPPPSPQQAPAYEPPSEAQPGYAPPAYPQPAYPQPAYPQPAYPGPAYPQPAYPQPAYPQPVAPQPAEPHPDYGPPTVPEPPE